MTSPNPPELDALIAQAKATEDTDDSAILVINGIVARVAKAVADFAAANPTVNMSTLTALTTDLKAKSDALAAAITAVP